MHLNLETNIIQYYLKNIFNSCRYFTAIVNMLYKITLMKYTKDFRNILTRKLVVY